ncbi:MAG TPA: hypothetical protein ENK23_03245, partial [Sorangium sp.]|nr:hypothetical protein [Sorangium sp.]
MAVKSSMLVPLLLLGLVGPLACRRPEPKFPDDVGVAEARAKWCAMINKHRSDGTATVLAECEAFYPAASAPFLNKMVGCYDKLLNEYGDDAPDSVTLIDNCTQQVLGGADPGDVSDTPAVKARCERMLRCQQVPIAACNKSFAEVDGMSRAVLSNMYNLKAQAEVAACLNDTAC